jgi:pyrroloquinoline quinone biosynthesis protein E
LNAFKVLKEEGLEFDLTCVASKINYKEIGDVIDLAHNYGAGSITINNMFHKDNAVKNWDKLALTKKEKDFVIKTILAKRKQYKNVLPIRTLRLIKTHPLEPCGAAESFVFIDADGLMHPCSLLVSKNSNYNDLRTHSLKDIFNSKEFEQVKKDSRNPIICPDCDRRNECGLGCRGYGYTFENNFFLKDPFCNK